LSRFHTIPACYGQTDGQTDGRSDGQTELLYHVPVFTCIVSQIKLDWIGLKYCASVF